MLRVFGSESRCISHDKISAENCLKVDYISSKLRPQTKRYIPASSSLDLLSVSWFRLLEIRATFEEEGRGVSEADGEGAFGGSAEVTATF